MTVARTLPLLLASASPRRKELLARLGVAFEVMVAPVVEHEEATAEPRGMVLHNAALKAAWVCARRPGAWVLAADTTVALDNQVLNKPRDLAEARGMLQKLSGRTHTVYTGVCLWRRVGPLSDGRLGEASLPEIAPNEISHCETSEVTFRALDDATITRYFALVNPLDKAGAYGIQEGRELILESYTGSLANIMGLPIEWLAAQLHGLALLPTPDAPIIADSRFHARARPTSAPPARPA
jgi:septum formation protein